MLSRNENSETHGHKLYIFQKEFYDENIEELSIINKELEQNDTILKETCGKLYNFI